MASRTLISLAFVALASGAGAGEPAQGQYRIAIIELTGRSSEPLLLDCHLGLECSGEMKVVIDNREETIGVSAKPESERVILWARHATRVLGLDHGATAFIPLTRGEGGATMPLFESPRPRRPEGSQSMATPLVLYMPIDQALFRVEVRPSQRDRP